MNPELKEEWLKALESGQYKQGVNYLNDKEKNTYCCLGVLCDILLKKKELIIEDEFSCTNKTLYTDPNNTKYCSDKLIPGFVARKYGIFDNEQKILAAINDDCSDSFEPAIKYIKENM